MKLLDWIKTQFGHRRDVPGEDEIWLQIAKNSSRGAYLSSDYAESFVPEQHFRRVSDMHAIMSREGAASYGLEDGWT